MNVSIETTGSLERKMKVQVPMQKVHTEVDQRLQEMTRKVKLQGFRPGKVPFSVVKQRFGKQVMQEVIADTMHSSYHDAIQKENLRPAGSPMIQPLPDKEDQLTYVATFEVFPEIKLVDPSTFEFTLPEVEIQDADVQEMIENLRKQRMQWNAVDRKSKTSDKITIDYDGKADEKSFPGGRRSDFEVVLGASSLVAGFEDQLIGVKQGDVKSFDITFPADYAQKELADKRVTFSIQVKQVQEGELPNVNEEFIRGFGVEDGAMTSFQNQLRKGMEQELKQKEKTYIKNQVMRQLHEKNSFELPKALVHQELHQLKNQTMATLNIKEEAKLPDSMFEEEAKRRVSLGLIINEVAAQNKMKVDQGKVQSTLDSIAAAYDKPQEVINYYRSNRQALAHVEALAMEEQIVDWTLEKSKKQNKKFALKEFMNLNDSK